MTTQPFRSIAQTLINKTVFFALFCALFLSVVQGYGHYIEKQHEQQASLQDIAQAYTPLLAIAVWDIEPETIQRLLNGIVARREIAHVRLVTHTGQMFSAGNEDYDRTAGSARLDIPYPSQTPGHLGAFDIYTDHAYLQRMALKHVLISLGVDLVFIAIMYGVIHVILRRDLQRPMREIADFVNRLNPGRLTTAIQLSRPARRTRDEIDLIIDGFQTLQEEIRARIATLDAQVAERTQQLEAALAEVRALSVIDPLTGCYNRGHLEERLPPEISRAERYQRPLSVVFMDLDHFKRINDDYGHAIGDAVLRTASERLREELREQLDWAARYGGEEFVVILPETTETEAAAFAERVRQRIAQTSAHHGGNELSVSASFGVTQAQMNDDAASLLARADALLYRAKSEGRNRVCAG